MKVYIHSEKRITFDVKTVLAEAKRLAGIEEEMQFIPLEADTVPSRGIPVLSLGTYKRRGNGRVVQTYSGAQIMAKADSLTRLSTAFQLLKELPELPKFEYKVVQNVSQCSQLQQAELICVDIETQGQVDAQVPAWEHIIALSIYDGVCSYVFPEEFVQDLDNREFFTELLNGKPIIGQNFKFDGKYLGCYQAHDTMLMHYSLFPAASNHGLKELALEYFAAEDWDSGNKQYLKGATYSRYTVLGDGAYAYPMKYPANSGYERIPRTELYLYAGYDTYWTWWLYQELKIMLDNSPDSSRVYEHLMRLSHMYQRVESAGNRFDVQYMDEFAEVLTEEGKILEAELHSLCGMPLNPRSPKQVKEYFASEGYKLKSTDADTMNELAAEGNEVAKKILAIRANSKMNGTYISGYRRQLIGDRGYQSYKLHAATTGRLGGAGPSMLTVPRDKRVKRMILPDEGQVVVSSDLSQAEMRILAVESNDPWMIGVFQEGAGDFFDLLIGNTYPELDLESLKNENPTEATSLRAKIKGVVYGTSFGRGAKAIAQSLEITVKEAQELIDGFVRPGSPFAEWRKMIERKALSGEPIVNKFGRHFQSELVTYKNRQNVVNSALSFISQSTGNDICLSAALAVEPLLEKYGARMMGTIHDCIYLSAPPEHAEELGQILSDELEKAGEDLYGGIVKFKSDPKIGNNLGEA